MSEESYFAQSPAHADTSINDIVEEGHNVDEKDEVKVAGVKRALLQSPEKSQKKSKTSNESPKKSK